VLASLGSNHVDALPFLVGCLWSRGASALADADKGLLPLMDQLTSSGTYIDTFLSLKLQVIIMRTIARILKVCNVSTLEAMCSCGTINTCCKFLVSAFNVIKDVTRLSQNTLFARDQKIILQTVHDVWLALINTNNGIVMEDLIDFGIIPKIVEDWLPNTSSIHLATIDAEYIPYVVRSESLKMLQELLISIKHSAPRAERLLYEVVRCWTTAGAVKREINFITTSGSKKTSAVLRSIASSVLALCATMRSDAIDEELLVSCMRWVCLAFLMISFAFYYRISEPPSYCLS
jgi:hypothetical protein